MSPKVQPRQVLRSGCSWVSSVWAACALLCDTAGMLVGEAGLSPAVINTWPNLQRVHWGQGWLRGPAAAVLGMLLGGVSPNMGTVVGILLLDGATTTSYPWEPIWRGPARAGGSGGRVHRECWGRGSGVDKVDGGSQIRCLSTLGQLG